MTGSKRLRTIRPRRLAVLGAFLAVAIFIAAGQSSGTENQADVRNDSFGVVYNGNPTQDCWKHHKPEGMKDSHYVIPLLPKALDMGQPREFGIQVENAWKHYISEVKVELNLSESSTGAPLIVPLSGSTSDTTPPLAFSDSGRLGNPTLASAGGTAGAGSVPPLPGPAGDTVPNTNNATLFFEVLPGAVSFYAELQLLFPEGPDSLGVEEQVEAKVFPAGKGIGVHMRGNETDTQRYLALPLTSGIDTITPIPGLWKVELKYDQGEAPFVDWSFNATAVYGEANAATFTVYEQLRDPPGDVENPVKVVDVGGVSDIITIPVLGIAPGVQTVDVVVTAQIYYKHQSAGTPDQDYFKRYYKVDIPVGAEFVATEAEASTGGSVESDFYLVAGEITGFSSAFLLVPSVLFGGTYGRATRKAFNTMLGGAKRRVMFHSLVSLGLTVTALVHIVLFLLEVRYSVLMGILWGGFGALSLLVLGLTGYYQVPLIQRFGYNWWRWFHLGFGIAVMAFVAYHAIADGPDFFFIKEQLPQWLNDVNSAQK